MNIAVDAMGGDFAPDVVVQGALLASRETGETVTLVGDERAIREALGGRRTDGLIEVFPCAEHVRMGDSPLKAIRGNPESSIMVAFDLVRKGRADAVVSAGNSGATLMAGILTLGKIEGVDRPTLAGILPSSKGDVILVDAGANVDCRPSHLLHFGLLAQAFATGCLGISDPLVGLLSIGEELEKGNDQVREAHRLFVAGPLSFRGNVEGRDIFSGEIHIIVCDGFVGNVVLKAVEGFSESVSALFKKAMKRTLFGRLGLLVGRLDFNRFFRTLDYETYGGAPVLGIKGVSVVCHGSSSPQAVKNGILKAVEYVRTGLDRNLSLRMAEFHRSVSGAS